MNISELQRITLAIADVRPLDEVLKMITGILANQPGVLLARIWLKKPGDICDQCLLRDHCPDRRACLHLVSSQTNPCVSGARALQDPSGVFRRFPLGIRAIGTVGKTGESVWLRDTTDDSLWLARTKGASRNSTTPTVFRDDVEGVQGFIGYPLVFRGEILGVLGVFCDRELDENQYQWLKAFANHAAVAINNAGVFGEIHELHHRLEMENSSLRNEGENGNGDDGNDIVGVSPALLLALQHARLVAPTEATVLLTGETGTGKTQMAKFIHAWSGRAEGNFVHVNCGSITSQLFESEFFGHAKGAFTGATRDRVGRFQFADRGTLFLDDVGEIPLELQSRLLKVIQTGSFERVGEDESRTADVRIIAATNRDLAELVKAGRFREDLYFSLSVFPLELPALHQRREDIPLLARHFLERVCRSLKRSTPEIHEEQMAWLKSRDWKGNIRELKNTIERAVIISGGGRLLFADWQKGAPEATHPENLRKKPLTSAELRHIERESLISILESARGRIYGKGGAAEAFGVPPSTIISRLKALGIRNRQRGNEALEN